MWHKHSVTRYQQVPGEAAPARCLPATRRMVPMIPQIGLVTADGGTSAFAEGIRDILRDISQGEQLCSSDPYSRQSGYSF